MSTIPRLRSASIVAPLLALGLGLSGCAVTGTDFRPGVAAEVGDRTVTSNEVDTITTDFCAAIESLPEDAGSQQFPLGLLRSQVATQLLLRAAADEVAEDVGVEAGPAYEQTISELETATSELSEDQQDAVLRFQGTQAYLDDLLAAIGARLLEDSGGSIDPNAAIARGQEELFDILRRSGDINPVYDVTISDTGQLEGDSAEVSTGVSDSALAAGQEQPDPAYVAALPESQRCG